MSNNRPVNLYILMQRFWRENEYEPFSTAAIALYFFLINRANSRRWQMPFKCPTSVISTEIQVTRQTVVNARESLSARKFITYTKGSGKGSHPLYSLVLTDELTECFTDELTGNLQDGSTVGLSDSLTPYNIEDRNIKDKNYSLNKTGDVKILSLEELEALLVNDEPWLNEIISLLSPFYQIELPELKSYLCNFFRYLRCQGTKGREEDDCRRYFVNWIKKQPINKTKTTLKPKNKNDSQTDKPCNKSISQRCSPTCWSLSSVGQRLRRRVLGFRSQKKIPSVYFSPE